MRQYPKEMMKNKEPASSCPIFKSLSTVGKSGDRTIRDIKFKKKIPTRERMGTIWE